MQHSGSCVTLLCVLGLHSIATLPERWRDLRWSFTALELGAACSLWMGTRATI